MFLLFLHFLNAGNELRVGALLNVLFLCTGTDFVNNSVLSVSCEGAFNFNINIWEDGMGVCSYSRINIKHDKVRTLS
jgi:hypothetical protein